MLAGATVGVALGQIVVAIVVGFLYVGFHAIAEPMIVRLSGCRELSKREAEWLLPMLHEVATRMNLSSVPRIVVDDADEPCASTRMRHITVSRGLLEKLRLPEN